MLKHSRVASVVAAILLIAQIGDAAAAEFELQGELSTVTGLFTIFLAPGTPVEGPVVFDDAAVGGVAGPADILRVDVNVGSFCFSSVPCVMGAPDPDPVSGCSTTPAVRPVEPVNCPLAGGTYVPIVSIDAAAVTFVDGFPAGGTFAVTSFSPTFGAEIPIFFDLNAGTVLADGTAGGLGTASGIIGFVRPDINVSPNPAVFADTAFGMTDSISVTVTNDGDLDLVIATVDADDLLADPFSVTTDGCTGMTLATGISCELQLTFSPLAGGLLADSFDIVSNDPTDPILTVDVSGTGLVGDIAVTPISFGSTTVGVTSFRVATVSNNGGAALAVGQITMPTDPRFALVSANDLCSNTSLPAAPGSQCTFQLSFTPTDAAVFMGTLIVPSDDPDTPAVTLNLSGTGVLGAVAEIQLSTEALAFDEVLAGQTMSMDIRVDNTGNAELIIDTETMLFSGADADEFSQSNDCGLSIAVEAFCTISVTFEPLALDGSLDKAATLTINSNANLRPGIDVDITASAYNGARVAVDAIELNFGSTSAPVDVGATATASTALTNTGNAALQLVSTTFSAEASEFTVLSQDCTSVEPGATCTITVQFAPMTEDDKMGTLTIDSNDADGTAPVVSLNGFVFRGPRIEPPAFEIDVDGEASIEIGQTASTSIALMSTGTQALVIDSIVLGGNNAEDFSFTEDCTQAPIESGSACNVGVTFAPVVAGAKSATLTITSNDVSAVSRGGSSTKVITLTANAVNPPPAPPPPLNVPPAFATSDVGGTGSGSLWLLGMALALLAMRRRQNLVRQIKGINMRRITPVLALVAAVALPPSANAVSFESESGDLSGSWDTTMSFGLGYRLQAPADNLIGTVNGGTKFSVNGDDGTLNFNRSLYSNAMKLTSELEINYAPGNLTLFARGFYFYDFEIKNGRRERTPLSQASLEKAGSDGDLLDAFISWRFDIGERPAELRVGEQVINWGESTFIQGGMNVINHINVSALRVPGAELREALLPQDLVFFSLGVTPNLDVEFVYQYDWDNTEPDAAGTFFSTNDFAVAGGTAVRLGFGDTPDTPPPAFFTPDHAFNAIPRGPDGTPADDGQWGWAARYFAQDFNNGTEFGIYYYNYHSRLPLISARTGSFEGLGIAGAIGLADEAIALAALDYLAMNPGDTDGAIAAGAAAGPNIPVYASQGIAATAITRGLPSALAIASAYSSDAFANTPSTGNDPFNSPAGQTAQFITEFPEDIQLYGFSWNTTLGQTAWQGEIAHHQNRPLQIDDLEILFAGLSSLRASFAQFGQLGSFAFAGGQANPATPPLTDINGYLRRDYTQVDMAFTRLFGPKLGADLAVALFEVGYHHVHSFPAKDVLRLDAAATVVSGNPDLAATAHPGKPLLDAKFFPDQKSWGYRLAGRLDYSNVFGSFNMQPRFAWQHDVDGITPGPAGAFIEGRKALTIGNRFSYQNQWEFDMSYSRFFGAGFQNEIHDRDFVAASVKFTF